MNEAWRLPHNIVSIFCRKCITWKERKIYVHTIQPIFNMFSPKLSLSGLLGEGLQFGNLSNILPIEVNSGQVRTSDEIFRWHTDLLRNESDTRTKWRCPVCSAKRCSSAIDQTCLPIDFCILAARMLNCMAVPSW